MRLTKLEIYGFKSFARRTEIVFPQNVTGIVGPNGSGKSVGYWASRALRICAATACRTLFLTGPNRKSP